MRGLTVDEKGLAAFELIKKAERNNFFSIRFRGVIKYFKRFYSVEIYANYIQYKVLKTVSQSPKDLELFLEVSGGENPPTRVQCSNA